MIKNSPIISYIELVTKEGQSLQRGMNFRVSGKPSVFLMSTKKNAPYNDLWESDSLVYEGHDVAVRQGEFVDKKSVDQPRYLPSGRLTENGKFFKAAEDYKKGGASAIKVQVYEKLDAGVWFDKGIFELIDAKQVQENSRSVFKFYLRPTNEVMFCDDSDYKHERLIPSWVKVEVWRRDKGRCTDCGATDGLHYDHILPYSKGGRSDDPKNIQILCARHNLQKSNKIQ